MKLTKLSLLATASLLFTGNAFADGDEPVNCRQVSVDIPYYSGWTSCQTWANGSYQTISQFVAPTTSSRVMIRENIGGEWAQCWADVPFSHFGQATGQVCDYTPKAEIKEHKVDAGDGTYVPGKTVVTFESSDRDGDVASREVLIDGVSVPVRFHELSVKPGQFSTTYVVKFKVVDNDGYETTATKNVIVSSLAICQEPGGFDSVCESEN